MYCGVRSVKFHLGTEQFRGSREKAVLVRDFLRDSATFLDYGNALQYSSVQYIQFTTVQYNTLSDGLLNFSGQQYQCFQRSAVA